MEKAIETDENENRSFNLNMETNPMFCKAIKHNGLPCAAPTGNNSNFCFHHDPARKGQAEEARLRGSEMARQKKLGINQENNSQPLKQFKLRSLDDVRRLLAATINEFRTGQTTADEARVMAYVANILIGAIKDSEIETRLAELEARIRERSPVNDRF
jgi:hypothetical protein